MDIKFTAGDRIGDSEPRAQKAGRVERRRTRAMTREDRRPRWCGAMFVEVVVVGLLAGLSFLGGAAWAGWIFGIAALLMLLFLILVVMGRHDEKRERARQAIRVDEVHQDEVDRTSLHESQGRRDEIRQDEIDPFQRLCLRHRLALLWADYQVFWGSVEFPRLEERRNVLERAGRCRRCRAMNAGFFVARPVRTTDAAPTSHGVVLNPTTATWSTSTASGPVPERRRLGATGEAVLYIAVVCGTVLGLTILVATHERSPSSASGVKTYYQDLKAGDCVRDMESLDSQGRVTRVDCSRRHIDEVFASFELPHQHWPGTSAVNRSADDGCRRRFGAYVLTPLDTSDLDWGDYVPVKESWNADRTVVCVLELGGYSTTGSLQGSGE
jgi:hypothetical protein